MKNQIYLDYNATTPMNPQILENLREIMAKPLNASSVHGYGREGRKLVENARQHISELTGAPAAQIIFNSGATEGNNTVLNHFKDETILVSAIEHPSVLEAAPNAIHIPVTKDGMVGLDELEPLLKEHKPALVSIMLVNNETGVIQPIEEISALVHKHGSLLHCDGVQAAGRIPINIAKMGIDFLTLSAHKIGGPQGVGALVLGLCGVTPTLLHGGGQEKSARAGTENVAGIAGFGMAAEIALKNLQSHSTELQDTLESALNQIDGVQIHGQNAPRVHNTTLFSIPGTSSETMLIALDLEGFAVSNGSACSSGTVKSSHVLKAMGISDEIAAGTLRISTGWATTEDEIKAFIEAFEKIVKRIQK